MCLEVVEEACFVAKNIENVHFRARIFASLKFRSRNSAKYEWSIKHFVYREEAIKVLILQYFMAEITTALSVVYIPLQMADGWRFQR